MKDWYYSLAMVPIYIATFLLWQQFPSRASFLIGGLVFGLIDTQARRPNTNTDNYSRKKAREANPLPRLQLVLGTEL